MKPGVYEGISFADYLGIDAINKSSLDWMRYSPKHYWANVLDPNRIKEEPTPAMRLGSAIHAAILEPAEFEKRYAKAPDGIDRRTKDGKIAWEAFKIANAKKEILDVESFDQCLEIAKAARKNLVTEMLLEEGAPEVTVVWIDEITKLKCKARLDWLSHCILDIKSTDSARSDDFGRKVVSYGWHIQAAFYVDGFRQATGEEFPFVFGAIEKSSPYAMAFYSASKEVIEIGRRIYRPLIERVAFCKEQDNWPGYPSLISELKLPAWAEMDVLNVEPIEF